MAQKQNTLDPAHERFILLRESIEQRLKNSELRIQQRRAAMQQQESGNAA